MRYRPILALLCLMAGLLLAAPPARALEISEDFTGVTTNNDWTFMNGACLTAGSTTATAVSGTGQIPSCSSLKSGNYYYTGDASLVGGNTGTLPDTTGNGALRFTNGRPYGYNESGAIISTAPFPTNAGVEVTFKTVTYLGDSGGSGGDGADGMSFFLVDASNHSSIGAFGGSLGYSCSNSNAPYDGLVGAYLGLGIDEFGNFLNGSSNTDGTSWGATGDNTATGGGYRWNRIGLRGAGGVAWANLTAAYGSNPGASSSPYYPATLATTCSAGGVYNASSGSCGNVISSYSCSSGTVSGSSCLIYSCSSGTTLVGSMCADCSASAIGSSGYSYDAGSGKCKKGGTSKNPVMTPASQSSVSATPVYTSGGVPYSQLAVQKTCSTGKLYNYSTPGSPTAAGNADLSNAVNTAGIMDYAAIPGAYSVLPSGVQIAKESATKRGDGQPIFYDLKITQDGLLSLSYSVNGGTYTPVITNQSITASNGPLPANFLFGFAGSTGGHTNIHEIMCFKAQPATQSSSSAGINQKQASKVESGTQAYFAYYNPSNWSGSVTANDLVYDATAGTLSIDSTPNWDASCVLTGGDCTSTGATGMTAPGSSGRVIVTTNGSGVGVPFQWSSLTATQQAALNLNDSQGSARLSYLRGDRSNEITTTGSGLFRDRASVLGDVVDSSPTPVGPPSSSYTATWKDRLYPSATAPENSGTSYETFVTSKETRTNVVYVGANDGLLHGFRAGAFDSSGNYVSTNNDGKELLAYMPGAVLNSIHTTAKATDFSNTQYSHSFYVDASPGTGDLYYGNTWHTWLVGGLGAGGPAIYALDVTDPSGFTESNASKVVMGEWSSSSITCVNSTTCGQSLGNVSGIPQIRRFHNGQWGAIIGNGASSSSGDAGIFIMLADPSTGAPTFYYLSTGKSGSSDGIIAVAAADLDGDHVTDYVYAGDLLGNVWRFDLTSNDPAKWAASSSPLFSAGSGQPITTSPVVSAESIDGVPARLMVDFGTGQKTLFTSTSQTTYHSGTQSLYGIWDWNLTAWNMDSATQYQALCPPSDSSCTSAGAGPSSTLARSDLTSQAVTVASDGTREGSDNTICWSGSSACSTGDTRFGWYIDLPGTQEQIIYSPTEYSGAFIVNSIVPANNIPTSCTVNLDTGYTYGVSSASGAPISGFFSKIYTDANGNTNTAGIETDSAGTSSIVLAPDGQAYLIQQRTDAKTPKPIPVSPTANVQAGRLTWLQRR